MHTVIVETNLDSEANILRLIDKQLSLLILQLWCTGFIAFVLIGNFLYEAWIKFQNKGDLKIINFIFLTSTHLRDYWIQDMDRFNWLVFLLWFMHCRALAITLYTFFLCALYILIDEACVLCQKWVYFHSKVTIMYKKLSYKTCTTLLNWSLLGTNKYWIVDTAQTLFREWFQRTKADAVFAHICLAFCGS